jgi:hypothetical protein
LTLKQVRAFVAANKWKFASTMPWRPHWYVIREKCEEAKFVGFVEFIRVNGVVRSFGKRTFVYFDLDGFTYWTMGNPVAETTIINRARRGVMATREASNNGAKLAGE